MDMLILKGDLSVRATQSEGAKDDWIFTVEKIGARSDFVHKSYTKVLSNQELGCVLAIMANPIDWDDKFLVHLYQLARKIFMCFPRELIPVSI